MVEVKIVSQTEQENTKIQHIRFKGGHLIEKKKNFYLFWKKE